MGKPRQDWCGRRLHSMHDPRNVGIKLCGDGVKKRFCLPCDIAGRRAGPLPRLALPPSQYQLTVIQSRADGMSDEEVAERDGITVDAVRSATWRARARLRVAPNLSTAVAVSLAYDLIKPDASGPLPRQVPETAPYAASVLALVLGRRRPMSPRDVQRARLLDALYAWSEPHAVSVLWAAGILKPRDLAPLFRKTKKR